MSADRNFLSFANQRDLVVNDFIPPADPLQYDDVLKFSNCQSVTVENIGIHGGRENAVDCVRGASYVLRNSAFMAGEKARATLVFKGAIDGWIVDRCLVGNGTESAIEVGQFDDYWHPFRKPTRGGLIRDSRTVNDAPIVVTCWDAEEPKVVGSSVRVRKVSAWVWFPYFCWRYVAIRAKRVLPWLACVCLMAGCQMPQWRVGQKSVPAPVQDSPAKVEAERAAADLIARKIETPAELKPVASQLSSSLGAPSKPITEPDIAKASEQASDDLRAEIAALQRQVEKQNKFLAKYAGKEIEGTGFNVFGPSMGLIVIGLIALGVACPPLMTLMFFVLRRMKATAGHLVAGVESFSKEEPEAAEKLKAGLSKAMDSTHKQLVRKLKVSAP
jgi:hypothetical protein